MRESVSEPQLSREFARLASGDRSVLSSVFRGLWPPVQRFCQKTLGNVADADDAAQHALEKLFAQASDYDPSRSALAWALTLAFFECRTIRRRSSRRQTQSLDDEHAHPESSPERAFEQAELRATLEAALRQLSEQDRETLEQALRSGDDEASRFNAVFRKRKQRALVRLKGIWRNLYGT